MSISTKTIIGPPFLMGGHPLPLYGHDDAATVDLPGVYEVASLPTGPRFVRDDPRAGFSALVAYCTMQGRLDLVLYLQSTEFQQVLEYYYQVYQSNVYVNVPSRLRSRVVTHQWARARRLRAIERSREHRYKMPDDPAKPDTIAIGVFSPHRPFKDKCVRNTRGIYPSNAEVYNRPRMTKGLEYIHTPLEVRFMRINRAEGMATRWKWVIDPVNMQAEYDKREAERELTATQWLPDDSITRRSCQYYLRRTAKKQLRMRVKRGELQPRYKSRRCDDDYGPPAVNHKLLNMINEVTRPKDPNIRSSIQVQLLTQGTVLVWLKSSREVRDDGTSVARYHPWFLLTPHNHNATVHGGHLYRGES